ncbi:hypothetical protein VNO77_34434 [Canavalia gladiata]|uniref:Uncharacterized protein n=1 Tax=Canavalia gladiata TaxID=3824 RepID=A0AAN9KEA4_CANGL
MSRLLYQKPSQISVLVCHEDDANDPISTVLLSSKEIMAHHVKVARGDTTGGSNRGCASLDFIPVKEEQNTFGSSTLQNQFLPVYSLKIITIAATAGHELRTSEMLSPRSRRKQPHGYREIDGMCKIYGFQKMQGNQWFGLTLLILDVKCQETISSIYQI